MKNITRFFALSLLLVALAVPAYPAATVFILNADGPGEGFNDPTPAAPVGGNSGTTLGQQRINAFIHAATIWAQTLDSVEPIYVVAAFNPLAPGVLGSAGAWDVFSDFDGAGFHPGSEFPATWYNSALADKRAGFDHDTTSPDISAQFSSNFNFYLGLDNNHGPLNDLVAVLLHELGHGLGFQNFVNESTGANLGNFTSAGRFYPLQTDIYSRHTLDTTNSLFWDQMTQAERQASAVRYGRVVWDGVHVNAAVPSVLSFGSPEVRVLTPAGIAGAYQFGTGTAFSPAIQSVPGVEAAIVAAVDLADTAGPATNDGCSPFTNAAAVAGNIALVERGTCGFNVKARNAEAAGAAAVIIYNNAPNANTAPPGMGADGLGTVSIISVSLTRADGLAIVGQLPNVTARIGVDPTIRAGANAQGQARLYMPFPVSGGSSGSHYDNIASRNLLMEPAINPDLTHSVKPPEDLTLPLMRDIGWFADADLDGVDDDGLDSCLGSNQAATVSIQSCDSGVANTLFSNGCTISDKIANCAVGVKNHGQFLRCVTSYTNSLIGGTLTVAQKDAIQGCAASSNIGK